MKRITAYEDYRPLLEDFYREKKRSNPRYSYQLFSEKAGITNRGLLINVIKGRRRLPLSHVVGVANAMNLSKSEFDYFENLVAFTDAHTMEDKRRFFERMSSVKVSGKDASNPQVVRREQYQYYSQWYHGVVRSLIGLHGFDGDFERLAGLVYPPLTAAQAKKSVTLLESLGFIEPCGKRGYRITNRTIKTAPEVVSIAVHNLHLQSLDIARKALNTLPRERRNFTGMNLGISKSTYQQLCRELEQFRGRLLELACADTGSGEEHEVYHLNLQLFAVSQPFSVRS